MDTSFLAPSGQHFLTPGISNAKKSRDILDWVGIDDFEIFNPYCHYYGVGATDTAINQSPQPVYIDYRIDYTKPLSSGLP
jgi:hypothetical protein